MSFHRVVVLSDLHLTPDVPLGNFWSGPELAAHARALAEEAREGHLLVLAGDIVDFLLLEDRPATLHLAAASSLAATVLQIGRAHV